MRLYERREREHKHKEWPWTMQRPPLPVKLEEKRREKYKVQGDELMLSVVATDVGNQLMRKSSLVW